MLVAEARKALSTALWNKNLETGGVVVGDEVAINLEIEMIKGK